MPMHACHSKLMSVVKDVDLETMPSSIFVNDGDGDVWWTSVNAFVAGRQTDRQNE